MPLLGYPEWLLGCCYAVARVPRMVAKDVARAHSVLAKGVAMRLLGYPGWLLRCCYEVARVFGVVARAVARVLRVVDRVLLSGC